MIRGIIIKGIAGFYYVQNDQGTIYECKAKGVFRKDKLKPLVGDHVQIDILDEQERTGNIVEILPRHNTLIRPAVANIDQALIIFAVKKPNPNLNLLDRFLVMMEKQGIETVICFNKMDLASDEELETLARSYHSCGYQVIYMSAQCETENGLAELQAVLKGKITAVAGPSGVGKSTLINRLASDEEMETGSISEKIDRGKHTTRHSQLLRIDEQSFIMDTPGFSSLFIEQFEQDELKDYYPEFRKFEGQCRFQGCAHMKEPDCAVKKAVEEGKISLVRYENYRILYEELKNKRKY